ncbi:hypothetical protein EDD15DRAFT_2219720 [Pisolithus albus]|nr:hypothetical protein EDD15DRAFT_2219720 [Pisolithus albus]
MPTSELSDALNPYYAQSRPRQSHAPSTGQHVQPVSQQHVPHHEGLELVMMESSRARDTPTTALSSPRPSTQTGRVTAVQELLRFLASTREACEIERRRRATWEQEMEAKHALQKTEMEQRILELQQEVTALRACLPSSQFIPSGGPSTSNSTPELRSLHPGISSSIIQRPTPLTPTCAHPSSSAVEYPVATPLPAHPSPSTEMAEASGSASTLASPVLPSARFINVNPSPPNGSNIQRGKSSTLSDSDENNSDASSSFPQHRLRRKNHHDNRCLTIQHAIRNHLLRVMHLDNDKQLPDSHVEGTPLGPDEPVRFVWDKTPKQSVHNSRMKERVLKDLKANRRVYKHVPDREFGKKFLEAAFDQAFVTLRQKFKSQRDVSVGEAHRKREDMKAMRARRLSRRKIKLGNRSEVRNRMSVFEHVTFDGALQLDCMSSEESEVEEDPATGTRTVVLRIRGCPWRSLRLQRFFDILDREDKVASAQKPRRGVGRKERYRGPSKERFLLPPKGVASWMVSKRWMMMIQASHSEVLDKLKDVIVDTDGFDWNQVPHMLVESDDEGWAGRIGDEMEHYTPHADSVVSSSLQNALSSAC